MWRLLVSIATTIGAVVLARTYTEEPKRVAVAPGAPRREAADGVAAADGAAEPAAEPALRPGWSRPKPEIIPRATYWPVLFAGGISFVFWGLISDIWIFGAGLILTIMSMIGWVNDLLNE